MAKHSSEHKSGVSDPSYQDKDIQVGMIAKVVGGILLVVVLAMVGMRGLFSLYERRDTHEPLSPLAVERQLPPEPRLQVNEPADLAAHRAWEASLIEEYRVIDAAAGRVQIPVERAMELVAQRGLPHRKTTTE